MLVFSGGLFKFDKDLKPYRYLRDFSLSIKNVVVFHNEFFFMYLWLCRI